MRRKNVSCIIVFTLLACFLMFFVCKQFHEKLGKFSFMKKTRGNDEKDIYQSKISKLSDMESSLYECAAKGGRRAICQATQVCISEANGLFLLDNSEKSGQYYYLSEPIVRGDQDFIGNESMANLLACSIIHKMFFKPALASRSKATAANQASNISSHEPITFHRNKALVVFKGYSVQHLSHLLFNLVLPYYDIVYGDAIQKALLYEQRSERLGLFNFEEKDERYSTWNQSEDLPLRKEKILFSLGDFAKEDLLPLFIMDNWKLAIEPQMLFHSSLQVNLPSWFIKPSSQEHLETWLTYHRHGGHAERLEGIHCFEYGHFGLAGSCAYNCSKTLSFTSLMRFKGHLMSVVGKKLATLASEERFHLRHVILKEDVNIVGDETLNVTIVQRIWNRSIFNVAEIYDKVLETLKSIPNLSFRLRLINLDQNPDIIEQVYIFKMTTILICGHGNAVGNFIHLPFEERRVALIELKPPHFPSATFFEEILSEWFSDNDHRLLYLPLYCDKNSSSIEFQRLNEKQTRNWDFKVDWNLFKVLFETSLNFTVGIKR